MASNLRVDSIVPATGSSVSIGTATGGVNIPGVLTYEDVTNVDSVGVITARSGIRIGATGANTLISGTGTGIGIGTITPNSLITIQDTGDTSIRFKNSSSVDKAFVGTSGAFGSAGTDDLRIRSDASNIVFGFSGSERLRIGSAGQIGLGGANYGTSGQVLTSAGSGSAVQWATPSTLSWTEHATFDFASTNANAITTTGIPSTARMVKINVFRLKHSATQVPYLRIGSSSGMHATGYTDIGTYRQESQAGATIARGIRQTVGWAPFHWDFNNVTNRYSGTVELNRISSTRWTYFCNIDVGYPSGNNAQYINHMHGHNETFNATLDRVSLYLASGNFEEGYATILSLS